MSETIAVTILLTVLGTLFCQLMGYWAVLLFGQRRLMRKLEKDAGERAERARAASSGTKAA